MNDMFFSLNVKSAILEEIAEVIKNEEDWKPYFNFKAKQVPNEVVQKDPFLRDLFEREQFVAGVTMMHPMSVYDWHTDERRGVSINMLVDSGFCMTLYTTYTQDLVRPIVAVQYKPEEYHFFNTQIPHSVLNFDKPRYLFTLEFLKDKTEFSHKDLLKVLSDMEIIDAKIDQATVRSEEN